MEFEWDEAKNRRNVALRSLSFELAARLFDGPTVETVDHRRDYAELRIKATGAVDSRILVCIYPDRGATRRIISLRFANRRERNDYYASL